MRLIVLQLKLSGVNTLKQHYQISVERLEAAADTPVLRFPAQSHDDLFAVVERSHKLAELSTQESTALAIGLKLIGEVVLEHQGCLLNS